MRIGLLGTVEARRGADPVPLPGLRLRGLLARLALDVDRPVPTGQLVDDLWGGSAPGGAGNALQALVSRLRRAIGAGLVGTENGGYRLRLDPAAVDAARFDRLVGAAAEAAPAAAREQLAHALALWRGPALSDLAELPFAASAATRLHERRAGAVEARARIALQLGDPEPELEALTAQLDALPLREHTAVLLARCLHAAGRQADALATLDRTIARLADELGVDPGAELAATRLAVLRAEVPPAPAGDPPSPLATALTSFVGRDPDLGRIRQLLADVRLVTLTGPGGAGKTRLAREAVTGRPGRVVLAELAALGTADQLPATLLSALGAPAMLRGPDEAQPNTARLLSALAGEDVLVVLDNCEHLVDAVARLAATLLEGCPRLRVLTTSREPLGVPGEVLHPVGALALPDAMRLFAERGAAVRPGFAPTADVAAVEEICRRLDGQPLPIELAAARLRTLSPAEIAARLDDRFRLLTSGARTALPRHQTLRAVVDWSWELLAEPERAVARRLAAFAGGATAAGAETVCSGPGGPDRRDVFDLLASLVDKSMVVAVGSEGAPTRYRMLETIREYAGEQLDESGERAAAEAAHQDLVLALVEEAEPHLRGADQLTWLARLSAEAEEIDLALQRAVTAGDAATAHRLVAGMAWFWTIRGLPDEPMRWVPAVHRLAGPVPPAAHALSTAYLALVRMADEDMVGAAAQIADTVRLLARLDGQLHPVLRLFTPAYALFSRDDDGPLRELAANASDDTWLRATGLCLLANHAANAGRIGEQRELARAAHALAVEVGDRFLLGMVVLNLGELEDVAGHHEAAAEAFDEAIALATELANDDDLPQFVARRAMLEARRGNLDAARSGLARARELGRETWQWTGALAMFSAALERMTGDLDAARAELDRAAASLLRLDHDSRAIGTYQRRASLAAIRVQVEIDAGDRDAAREHLAEGIRWALEGKDGPCTAAVAEAAARLAFTEGDPQRAAELLGVAAAQRGEPDRGNREVVDLHAAVRRSLGADAADRAVRAARELPRVEALALLERSAPALRLIS